MEKKSDLIFPVGMVCAGCLKTITVEGVPKSITEQFAALEKAFSAHVEEKHSGENSNQG